MRSYLCGHPQRYAKCLKRPIQHRKKRLIALVSYTGIWRNFPFIFTRSAGYGAYLITPAHWFIMSPVVIALVYGIRLGI